MHGSQNAISRPVHITAPSLRDGTAEAQRTLREISREFFPEPSSTSAFSASLRFLETNR
jgi:hypothetical protein